MKHRLSNEPSASKWQSQHSIQGNLAPEFVFRNIMLYRFSKWRAFVQGLLANYLGTWSFFFWSELCFGWYSYEGLLFRLFNECMQCPTNWVYFPIAPNNNAMIKEDIGSIAQVWILALILLADWVLVFSFKQWV